MTLISGPSTSVNQVYSILSQVVTTLATLHSNVQTTTTLIAGTSLLQRRDNQQPRADTSVKVQRLRFIPVASSEAKRVAPYFTDEDIV